MKFAPVCIPTLNRYEHLRKCLESLSRCSWADQTEVYVALDYPPTNQWDKYAPGWEKNREFLRSCGNMGFKKLHVIERTENYGIWTNPDGKPTNFQSLYEEYIVGKYDRYIYSEDDNVFSPNFLEFINKGLDEFETDKNVLCISGYRFYFPIKFNDNTFIRQTVDYCPWGLGRWIGKFPNFPYLNYKWFRSNLTFKNIRILYRQYGMGAVCALISLCSKEGNQIPVDRHLWTYMQLTGLQQITPTVNLVENIGLDGSGETHHNCSNEEWALTELNKSSEDLHFDFVGTGYEYFKENHDIYYHGKYWMTEFQYFIKALKKFAKVLLGK